MLPAQIISLSGYGRARIMNEKLSGQALQGDTSVSNKGTDGDMVFDLGIHLRPYDYLRAKTLIRLRNKFGVFFGQGASVEFRQILIEGLISKKVKYALGDIDIKGSPYTLFNNSDSSAFEAELFKTRREISQYENFNTSNYWRIQGANATATLLVNNTKSSIKLDAFAARTRPTNYYKIPDRFLAGGAVNGNIEEQGRLGFNYISLFELKNQVDTQSYNNQTASFTLQYHKKLGSVKLGLEGEGGGSLFHRTNKTYTYETLGQFYDVKGSAEITSILSKLTFGYKHVDAHFFSPAAQTLRIHSDRNNSLFAYLKDSAARDQLYFDRITDASLYNQTIRPILMPFLPQYGNALPYGTATPNRQGLQLQLSVVHPEKALEATLSLDQLKELEADTLSALRNFTLVKAGAALKLHQLLKLKKMFLITGGFSQENTKRSGNAPITLLSRQIDAGLSKETITNLDILGGYKYISANGNEYLSNRDSDNNSIQQAFTAINLRQSTWSAGLRYRFGTTSFLMLTGNWIQNNQGNANKRYNINQYFISYILKF